MTNDDFMSLLLSMEEEERETISGKGNEYTRGQSDRLSSFKEIASFAGVTPKQVCMIFMSKHYQGLANFVATGKVLSNEDVNGRIMDLRVYLSLMRAIIKEERENAAKAADEGEGDGVAEGAAQSDESLRFLHRLGYRSDHRGAGPAEEVDGGGPDVR